jgi:hypothetical protein
MGYDDRVLGGGVVRQICKENGFEAFSTEFHNVEHEEKKIIRWNQGCVALTNMEK